jgi:glycosyltransferase involved in cell wall biosynthesis
MKLVIHVGQYGTASFDGVSVTVAGQVDGLHTDGLPVEVWSFCGDTPEPTLHQTLAGAPHWKLPVESSRLMSAIRLHPLTISWIRNRLSEIGLFHIHSVFTPRNNLVAKLGKPYVLTPNGGWSPRVLSGRNRLAKSVWIQVMEKWMWSNASGIQAVSESEAVELRQLPSVAPVRYIPNGMNIPECSGGPTHSGRDLWLFIGRLAIEQKGLDRMVRAYALCKDSGTALPPLVIAGPDFRGGHAVLSDLIRSLGMEQWIQLPGPVVGLQKRELLARASLFLHTSVWEGMPLAMLEAMANGIPCLATAGTNLKDVITQYGAGYPAGESVPEIAAAMAHARDGNTRRAGLAARCMVRRNFSWPSVARELQEMYRPILGLHQNQTS